MLNKLILVFIGGGLGSGIRSIVNIYTQHLNYSQASTLFVNIFGSFLFGLFFVILQSKTSIINVFVLTGVLGGFTTFSQFSFDVVTLQNNGNLYSIIYILSSVLLSISMALLGIYIANRFINS